MTILTRDDLRRTDAIDLSHEIYVGQVRKLTDMELKFALTLAAERSKREPEDWAKIFYAVMDGCVRPSRRDAFTMVAHWQDDAR